MDVFLHNDLAVQIFGRASNTLARLSIALPLLFLGIIFLTAEMWTHSSYNTGLHVNVEQPIAFSHKHHVKGLGLDCRFCHGSVEKSSYAGMPPTHTCIGCHSHIWSDAPVLKDVRESDKNNVPLQWWRVHVLPDFVYFDHSVHIHKGLACANCHGHVEEMAVVHKDKEFYMRQCLDCHRHPDRYFNVKSPVDSRLITNCTACHR